jgi:outer membrane murein-binding lipoprotein Lpp
MMIRYDRPARAAVLVVILLVAGCATPAPVVQLAERTSGSVSLVNTQLEMLAQDSRRLAELRAANIGRLQADMSEVKLRYDIDLEVMQRTGETSRIDQAKTLRDFVQKLATLREESGRAAREREARVIARYQTLAVPAQQLNQIASELAVLGKDEDLKTRVKFLSGYAESVAAEVEARQKEKVQAIDKANTEVDANAKKDPAGKKDAGK